MAEKEELAMETNLERMAEKCRITEADRTFFQETKCIQPC